tara:strand:+ start:3313 stop:3801 length:489 start_codon:yes stop_codon:yes gene_type:complete
MTKQLIYKQIWETFSNIEFDPNDVSFNEAKNKQTGEVTKLFYLKWSVALRILAEHYPDYEIEFERFDRGGKVYDVMYYPNECCSVHCTITINGVSRNMWLAVTNYKHDAVTNPDARDISDSKMRCMVKCLSLFGLGKEMYEGSYKEPELTTREITNENQASQ